MLTELEIFKLIQDKNLISKAQNTILQSELTGRHFEEKSKYGSTTLRFRANNTGVFNVDYLDSFKFEIPKLSFTKEIQFFKPLGFYWFDKPMKLAFWVLNKYKAVSLGQDDHPGLVKNVNIFKFNDDPLNDAVIAGFSAENAFVIKCITELIENGSDGLVTKTNSLFTMKEFTVYPKIDLTTFKYVTMVGDSHIQVYLKDNADIIFPILGTTQTKQIKINPAFKKYYDKFTEFDILSYKTQ